MLIFNFISNLSKLFQGKTCQEGYDLFLRVKKKLRILLSPSPVEVVCFGKYLLSASSITVAEKKIIVGETNALGGNIYNITPYSLILCATLVYFFCK